MEGGDTSGNGCSTAVATNSNNEPAPGQRAVSDSLQPSPSGQSPHHIQSTTWTISPSTSTNATPPTNSLSSPSATAANATSANDASSTNVPTIAAEESSTTRSTTDLLWTTNSRPEAINATNPNTSTESHIPAEQHSTSTPEPNPSHPQQVAGSISSTTEPIPSPSNTSLETGHSPASGILSSFSFFNVQGLVPQTKTSKVPYISDHLTSNNNQLFIGLTETWLHNQLDAEIQIDNYSIYRADSNRKKSKYGRFGGGAAIYLRNDIASTFEPILTFSNGSVEIVCIHSADENLLLATLYRQPDNSSHDRPSNNRELKSAITKLQECINKLETTPDVIIGGDFNLPNAKWPECTPGNHCPRQEAEMITTISELCTNFHLTQMITEATHYQGNTLDLVFTNNTHLIHDHSVVPTLRSISHHHMVTIQTQYKASNLHTTDGDEHSRLSQFDYLNFHSKDANWDQLRTDLNAVNWFEELNATMTPDEMLDSIYKLTLESSQNTIPLRKNPTKRKSRQAREIYNLKRRKRRINKLLLKATSTARKQNLFNEQIQVEIKLQKLLKNTAKFQEEKAVDAIKENSKYFFSYAKKKSKVRTNVGPLRKKSDNQMTSDSSEMSEVLADQYSTVFSTPTAYIPPTEQECNSNKLENHTVTEEDIKEAIDELRNNAASGADGFPAILLKQCRDALAKPLQIFWNKCMECSHIPERLKFSIIPPLYKGGSKSDPANYRPVALTSHLIKIYEKTIRKKFTYYFHGGV